MEDSSFSVPPRHIFIIEDDLERGRSLAEAFEGAGWRASLFRDGIRALSLVVHDHPSLLLVGMGHGSMDRAWALLTLLRETLQSTRHIPVLVYAEPALRDTQRMAWLEGQGIPFVSAATPTDDLLALADSLPGERRHEPAPG